MSAELLVLFSICKRVCFHFIVISDPSSASCEDPPPRKFSVVSPEIPVHRVIDIRPHTSMEMLHIMDDFLSASEATISLFVLLLRLGNLHPAALLPAKEQAALHLFLCNSLPPSGLLLGCVIMAFKLLTFASVFCCHFGGWRSSQLL